jgi:putative ABC transport system permease protein
MAEPLARYGSGATREGIPTVMPPRWGLLLLRVRFRGELGEVLTGDLLEGFHRIVDSGTGLKAARRWFRSQVLSSLTARPRRAGRWSVEGRARGPNGESEPPNGPGRWWNLLTDQLPREAGIALRALVRHPLLTGVATLTLALGIGANAVLLDLSSSVLLRPLPFRDPESVVGVYRLTPEVTGSDPAVERIVGIWMVPYDLFRDWQELGTPFSTLGAFATRGLSLTGEGEAVRLGGMRSTSGVFATLGTTPALGRLLSPEDDAVGAAQVVVLSHATWSDRFGSDPTVIGRSITLSGQLRTIVGVLPADFHFLDDDQELWINFADEEKTETWRAGGYLKVLGRLKPGFTLKTAQAEMEAVVRRLGEEHPEEVEHGIRLVPALTMATVEARPYLFLLLGAVAMVLLIAGANLTGLLLVRSLERGREMAVRTALGASRLRIALLALVESVLLTLPGGVLGALLAFIGLRPFVGLFPTTIPRSAEIQPGGWTVLTALALSLVVGLLIGLVLAVRLAGRTTSGGLHRVGVTHTGSRGRNRAQAVLVAAQIALAFVLLSGAGLFHRSYHRLVHFDKGFDPTDLLIMDIALPEQYRFEPAATWRFFEDLHTDLAALPGVAAVTAIEQVPVLAGLSFPPLWIETEDGVEKTSAHRSAVQRDYLQIMDIPILQGRGFTAEDRYGAPPVVVVNRRFADRYWPDQEAVGQRINTGSEEEPYWQQVVGVVGDVFYRPGWDFEEFYETIDQYPSWYLSVLLRTRVPPATLTGPVREVLREKAPDIPVEVGVYADRIRASGSFTVPRTILYLLGILGSIAVLLAVMGIYGTLAFTVARNRRDIGIRVALGASRERVVRDVVWRGLGMTGCGLAGGLLIALATGRLVEAGLFQVRAADPGNLAVMAAVIVLVALAASFVPAWRAVRIDPARTLRQE